MSEQTYLSNLVRDELWSSALEEASDWTVARICNIVFGPGEGYADSYSAESVAESRPEIESALCDAAYMLWTYSEDDLVSIADLLGLYY